MAEDKIKQTIKGDLVFNHLDPHYARFNACPATVKKGSSLVGMRPVNITPDMFPADFELSTHDITGSFEFTFEITKKK